MTLSDLSIRRPVFAWMLMAALIIFGALCFHRLGVSTLPDVDFPVVSVALSMPGAAPEVMETQVVDIIEDAVMGIQGIVSVESSSRQSSAQVTVEFELGRDIDVAVQEVQARIAQVQRMLPRSVDPPTIRKRNPEDQPILWLTLTSDPSIPRDRQMMYARNVLFDQFATLEGVGDINLGGYVDPNLRVWLSIPQLRRLELTADDVVNAIRNEHTEIPAGRLESGDRERNLRFMGEALTAEDFGKIPVNLRGGGPNYRPIPLRSVAKVEEGLADIRRISRFDGKPAIGLGILKQHGANAVDVADRVKEKVKQVIPSLPTGMSLQVRMDTTTFIRESVAELTFTLLLSALFTSLVCFFFLGSWSSTVNVLMAIPTSIVGTFMAIYFFGFTLNTFTLLGLSLAIGLVVDDAIMMLENIVRHVELGLPRRRAALEGAREITFAALVATLAIVAIFLPVVFMKGIIGRYFYQYGITVTVAVLLSLLEALTLTPMRCSRFLRVGEHAGIISRWMDQRLAALAARYRKILARFLEHPVLTSAGSIVFFLLSLVAARFIPGELLPAQDQGRFILRLKSPVGSSIEATDARFRTAEEYLKSVPEVNDTYSAVGGFSGDAVNEGMIFVGLKPAETRRRGQREVMEQVRRDLQKKLKGTRIAAQDLSMRGFTSGRGFPIEFTVQGPNWDKLAELSEQMVDDLEETGVAVDANSDYDLGMPEVQIVPDRTRAALRGVSLTSIAQNVNALIGGAILNANTRYPKERHRYDINVRLIGSERARTDDVKNVFVRNNRGELIPLTEVVTVRETPTLPVISRRNRERAIKIHANVAVGHAQSEALRKVRELGTKLPSGYHIVMTGSAQSMQDTFRSLLFAMALGILVSYMVLASQFNSFLHPVSVLMAMPFSISGALLALLAARQSLNMMSLIGIILLLGIVKKNSILLVDFTNQKRREEGLPPKKALLEACPVRLRPILMTSVATVAGAIPVAIGFGPGAETRVPMAVAIVGGVIVSTVLSLVVVPCVYLLLTRVERNDVAFSDVPAAG